MDTKLHWRKLYIAATQETDWSKMEDRISAVEIAIKRRLHALPHEHFGTPTELHAIADIRQRLWILRADVARWQEFKALHDPKWLNSASGRSCEERRSNEA